jgi:cobalt-precorrin-7 (C5)-methyltransferase
LSKINVIGLGPGHRDYILPKAMEIIENSDIIAGGKRHLESISITGKETFIITGKLDEAITFIKGNYKNKILSVVVSGDPCFYSMLNLLKKHFKPEELNIIAGISSLQYMFSKIGTGYEEAYIGSLHGREMDLVEKLKEYKTLGLLTDTKWTPEKIARTLIENNVKDKKMYIGENLSYEDEKITEGRPEDIKGNYKMAVVVIADV